MKNCFLQIKLKSSFFKRLANYLAIFSLLFNALAGVLVYLPTAFAQETPTPEATSLTLDSNSETAQSSTPENITQNQQPAADEQTAPEQTTQPGTDSNQPEDQPTISAQIQTQPAQTTTNPIDQIINQFKAFITTDQTDYAPESVVKITGSGFEPNQNLTFRVTWPDGTIRGSGNRLGETDKTTTDAQGNLSFEYQLTAGLEGEYKIEVLNSSGQVLKTASFTDNHEDEDETPPESQFTSPEDESFWGQGGIYIAGSSTDFPQTTVDFVTLWGTFTGEDDWFEIAEIPNESLEEPFFWSFNWTPEEEGTYDILAEATDTAGNVEGSPIVESVTYDVTAPVSEISYPEEDARYIEDVWEGEISGTASDSPSSGVSGVLVSIQRDVDGFFWDDDDGEWVVGEEEEEEYLNQAEFDTETGEWNFIFDFIEPEGEDEGYTVRSHALDNAGNLEATNVIHFFFGRAPIIADEASTNPTSSSVTISWTTDHLATSRVVYDTTPHPVLAEPPNYGYANSTTEADTDPKVISHQVTIDGLTAGTTYFYRTVSAGSPESVGDEKTFTTAGLLSPAGPTFAAPGPASPPICGDQKPGSAPTLLTAQARTNEVVLTWTEATDPVSYYLVSYGIAADVQLFGNPNVGGKGTTSYTVKGLSGGTTYYFKVRAGNGCAPGDFSNQLSTTPGGGVITGTAVGFVPGVFGSQTQVATPSAQATPAAGGLLSPSPAALGVEAEVKGVRNWPKFVIIAIVILGGIGLLWLVRRKSNRL